jgi:hypothetical protein
VATQRGRAPQFIFIMSRINKAVVDPSSVTDFSSGAVGGFTADQSSRMSAESGAAEKMRIDATATAANRKKVILSDMIYPFESLKSRWLQFENCGPLSEASYAFYNFQTTDLRLCQRIEKSFKTFFTLYLRRRTVPTLFRALWYFHAPELAIIPRQW